jgi:diguanylate cyclase (GGDEF)-like protein
MDEGRTGAAWVDRVQSLPVVVRWSLGLFLVALVSILDHWTGSEVSFSIFYLTPVSFASAFVSRRAGWLLATLSAVAWGYLEVLGSAPFSAPWVVVWNGAVRLGFFVLVTELIVRLRRAHALQRVLARQDALTGLANTREFIERSQGVIAASRRHGRPFTLAYIDLDRFKRVNDVWGHAEGDRLLKAAAELMVTTVRSTDVVARLGGDEFAILMPEADLERARMSLARVAAALTGGLGRPWAVGATVGAVTFLEAPADVDSAVREADALMYRGKEAGRGQVVIECWPPRVTVEPESGASSTSVSVS